MTDNFWNRPRGCADLLIFGPFILLFLLLLGGSCSGDVFADARDAALREMYGTAAEVDAVYPWGTVSIDAVHLYDGTDFLGADSSFAFEPRQVVHTAIVETQPADYPLPPVVEEVTLTEQIDILSWPTLVGGMPISDVVWFDNGWELRQSWEGHRMPLVVRRTITGPDTSWTGILTDDSIRNGRLTWAVDASGQVADGDVLGQFSSLWLAGRDFPAMIDGVALQDFGINGPYAIVPEPAAWVLALLWIGGCYRWR